MRLTFLGTGDAFCDWRVNYNNNAVIETAEGLVLLDCGLTAVQSMRELGLSVHDVAAVLITHVHADHVTLAPLLLERFYGGRAGPAFQPTRVYSPPDVMTDVRRCLGPLFAGINGPEGGPVPGGLAGVLIGVPAHQVQVGGLRFRFFPVPHVSDGERDKPAYGVEIAWGVRRVLYTSDTTFRREWLVRVAREPDVVALFHDCTFSPCYPGTVHTHFDQLCTLPPDVQARITLMHHVAVPDGVDIRAFAGAAGRHQAFEL
ncbi:MBL fold metallo-hydrolase [Myxococcota bacterium]|nr:MBL fold metallo-hydrolase [Myxococcota bacterium]